MSALNPSLNQRAPLRKIVGHKRHEIHESANGVTTTVTLEVLECGHEQRPKLDHNGHTTNAYARRCVQCMERESS